MYVVGTVHGGTDKLLKAAPPDQEQFKLGREKTKAAPALSTASIVT